MKNRIKNNPRLKGLVHFLLIPRGQARPRRWVSWFVNPFFHRRGKGARISRPVRLDVLPFQPFELGKGATVESFSVINNGVGGVYVGDHVRIGISNVVIGPVRIGNDVIIAQNVVLSGLNHGYEDVHVPIRRQPVTTKEIVIEEACWIGANSVVTAGVRIGRHSVVAAGSVVTRDVPPYCVVAGSPAKIIRRYEAGTDSWVRVSVPVS